MTPRTLVALAVLLVSSLASADAVDLSLMNRALIGQGLPRLDLQINDEIAGFEVKLTRSDGKKLEFKGGGRPGTTRSIELAQPEGRFHYTGELTVLFKNGDTGSMPLEFDAELYGALKMTLEKKDVDLANRKVVFRLSRPAKKAEVTVQMDTGDYAFDSVIPFAGEPGGTPLEVSWPAAQGRVLKIAIKAFDDANFFTGVEIFPWQIDIPHEEVNFASGKWDITADEAKKLEHSYKQLAEAVAKYGRLARIRLYVAGHTDTVGSLESNRSLSLNRARAIGAWFRKRGLRIPVHYEGFGEQALLVGTGDEVDESRNRRAEYIIAVEDPVLKSAPFTPNWRKL
jgi:outer membrane protein OmpA-like peptidoglycan-associated protein